MIKQLSLLAFLFSTQISLSMDLEKDNPIITKAIWMEHINRNPGSFSHDIICALALVDQELYRAIKTTSEPRKKYLMRQKNYLELCTAEPNIDQKIIWHIYGSCYVLTKNSNNTITLHIACLDGNDKVDRYENADLSINNASQKDSSPYFDEKGNVVYAWYIDSVNSTNEKNIIEYAAHKNGVENKRKVSKNCILSSHERSDFLIKNKRYHNKWYVGGSFSKDIALLDIASGKRLVALEGHDRPISCCIEAQKGSLLLSGSWDETIKIWNTNSNTLATTIDTNPDRCNTNRSVSILCLAEEKDSFCSSALDNVINIWDMPTGKVILSMHGSHINTANCLAAWSLVMRNNLVYIGSGDGTLTITDPRSGKKTFQNRAHKRTISCLVPCKNSDTHFYSGSYDGVVNRWDMRNSQLIALGTHDYGVSCLYESVDSKKLFSGGADGIRIWDATGQTEQPLNIIKKFNEHKLSYVDCIAANDDITKLYVSSFQGINILALKK